MILKKKNNSFLFFLPCFFLTCLVFPLSNSFAEESLVKIHYLDAGYGEAAVIELPGKINVMIDAGEREQGREVIDYLQSLNVNRIHHAIMTHPHKNHFGGFLEIVESIPIENFYLNGDERSEEGYEDLLIRLNQDNINMINLKEGDTIKGLPDGVEMNFFKPGSLKESVNGNSLVTWLKFQNTSFLFMADIGKKEQRELFVKRQDLSFANVITVPHHGRDIALPFYRFFFNKIFIVSTGPNEWGMPDLTSLSKLKGEVYRTDQQGIIVVESNGQEVKVVHGK